MGLTSSRHCEEGGQTEMTNIAGTSKAVTQMEDSEEVGASGARYNILPFNVKGSRRNCEIEILEIPEIKEAIKLLRRIEGLPMPMQEVQDLFDWLHQSFGFQKDNVMNQKEHLILLISNISMRQMDAVLYLKDKILENYIIWCQFLHLDSNVKHQGEQLDLLYIGLYLLIWGEAFNIRFMPECICYIFHHMANDLNEMLRNGQFEPPIKIEGSEDAFLQLVIQPLYDVSYKEFARSKGGTVSHSEWRNYEDLNEYFWSKECFNELGWPMDLRAEFFTCHTRSEKWWKWNGRRMSKTNFVEVRTFLHIFRSFNRMWTFFILTFQTLVIIAWSSPGSISNTFRPDTFRNVKSVFITAAFLNFLQVMLDIILSLGAWRSLASSEKKRHFLKFGVSLFWMIIMAMYSNFIRNPPWLVKFINSLAYRETVYNVAILLYTIPILFNSVVSIFRPIRMALKCSNSSIIKFILWWTQPKSHRAEDMYEDSFSLLKYTVFWIILLICKLSFSFYVQISPLIEPTKEIVSLGVRMDASEELLPNVQHNSYILITMWVSIVLVYFVDSIIWYSILSTIYGGVNGILSHLGEIRTLGILRSRFEAIPKLFVKNLVPQYGGQLNEHLDEKHLFKFADIWNAFINSLREEDLLSNREKKLLIVPPSGGDSSVFQLPPFLLVSKIPIAIDMAKSVKKKDGKLIEKIKKDVYILYALTECYETSFKVLYELVAEPCDRIVFDHLHEIIEDGIKRQSFLKEFQFDGLPLLITKFDKLLNLLKTYYDENDPAKMQIANLLQDIIGIITNDIMKNGQGLLNSEGSRNQLFANLNLDSFKNKDWREKCVRLQLLLTTNDSVIYVPRNLDARRRITFFANSLFMKMPRAPPVRNMMSFSVLTPYYKEVVLYSQEDIHKKTDEGVSVLFYLQKNYSDEWDNFLERKNLNPKDEGELEDRMDDILHWASLRGQTLTRTVRGVMYYKKALEMQHKQDKHDLAKLDHGGMSGPYDQSETNIPDIKFQYVVACQVFGIQKKSMHAEDRNAYLNTVRILNRYPSLRVAFIDEVDTRIENGTTEKMYYSVLVKGGTVEQEIYRIKLPGRPIGEGKPENQNHAIIFTRGEALQPIDMNQDNYMEESFKLRNVLEEFQSKKYGKRKPTILGLREHIFTGSVSSVAWFMCNQETSFVTIGQRILANLLKVRFHYGHADIFDRIFHITTGGISKASKIINISEDIFSGFNSTMRGGNITHHEYIQVGKGRDVGFNQITSFEAKVASGNGELSLSREVYRLGHGFDFFRLLSFYFTTVGTYFCSLVTILAVFVFLYGRVYLVLSGLEKAILLDPNFKWNVKPLEKVLPSQSLMHFGLILVLPMLMELGVEKGFRNAMLEFIIMHIQLASIFFTFQLGTKVHYFWKTVLHGDAKYRPTGRGFAIHHTGFSESYRLYSSSHFVKGFELLILLVIDRWYGSSYYKYFSFANLSTWILCVSWLFSPAMFNPSGFEWEKFVDDWNEWWNWLGNKGHIGMTQETSWEAWWSQEIVHLRKTSCSSLLLDIVFSFRFLIFQYGILYNLDVNGQRKNIGIYFFSWIVLLAIFCVLKMIKVGRKKFGSHEQVKFRFVKAVMFFLLLLTLWWIIVSGLSLLDILSMMIGFTATSWFIVLIGQACSRWLINTMFWPSIMELRKMMDTVMGLCLIIPIGILSWFRFVSELQSRLLFNMAFSRGLHISRIFADYN